MAEKEIASSEGSPVASTASESAAAHETWSSTTRLNRLRSLIPHRMLKWSLMGRRLRLKRLRFGSYRLVASTASESAAAHERERCIWSSTTRLNRLRSLIPRLKRLRLGSYVPVPVPVPVELKEEVTEQPESVDANVEEEDKKDEPKEEESEKPESVDAFVEEEEKKDEPSDPFLSESQPGSGRQGLSLQMEVPNDKVGLLFGKSGDTIWSLQDNSGAKIQISRGADADPQSTTMPLELVGTLEDINKAEKLIKDVFAEANAGGSSSFVSCGFNAGQADSRFEQVEILVPNEKIGLIIGKGGETIRNMMIRSNALIEFERPNPSDEEQSKERIVRITGEKRQMESAREMIKDIMNQTVRQSPLSSGYSQQKGHLPCGPVTPQRGSCGGSHHSQFSGYDYPQRAPPSYPSQNSQYPLSSNGNYPPPVAPRSNYSPGWDQRPPTLMHGPLSQGNYNYGQHPGPEYGHHPPSSQTQPPQSYTHGYKEAKYDNHAPPQHYGPQLTPYAQGDPTTHSGYGPPEDQYGKPPPMYNMQQPQGPPPHAQPYGQQPRPNQPVEAPKQGPAQMYRRSSPLPQHQYPYAPSGPMQQTYPNPPYGSAPASAGYGQTYPNNPPAAASSGYGQPVAGYGQQPGVQQQPQAGSTGGFSMYPAAYGYQAPVDLAAYGAPPQQGPLARCFCCLCSPTDSSSPGYNQSGGYGYGGCSTCG